MRYAILVLSIFYATSMVDLCPAQEWTRFRGSHGQGQSESDRIPIKWNQDQVAWKTTLPGEGHSSPVIWGDKVFVTCWDRNSQQGIVAALNCEDGTVLWEKRYGLVENKLHTLNNNAASTPAVDDRCVYVLWLSSDQLQIKALTHAGREVWTKTLGPVHSNHGFGSSPILYKDKVIIAHEQRENDLGLVGRWLSLDKATGDIKWELQRNNSKLSYMTPCIFTDETGGDQLIFTSLSHGVTAVDPADGKVMWEISGIFDGRTIGSPVFVDGCIVATCGAGGGGTEMVVIKPGSRTTQAELMHKIENRFIPFIPSAISVHDRLFTFHDQGTIACWDVHQGQLIWSERYRGKFFGSPVAVNDRIYCISASGDMIVLRAGDEYDLLAVNPLGEESQATPAISDNRLYLRTKTALTCIAGNV